MTIEQATTVNMDEIAALAKRRGFMFPGSEIYGGMGGFFDYGPLGAILKRNVKDAWWRETVELRDDIVAFGRPHYAKAGTDVEYLFPWGWGELESIAYRGTYDLDAHMKLSGKDLTYFEEATKAKYTPILIESSAGIDRTTLTMLIDAYDVETIVDPENGNESKRTVLRFHPKIAPVAVGVFPLARNKPDLVERAHAIERGLRSRFRTQYDEGNVGQLYRRQDEIGTPFCLMVDYQTLEDATITVRDRDSMLQDRIGLDRLDAYLDERT